MVPRPVEGTEFATETHDSANEGAREQAMPIDRNRLERELFRRVNAVVEPAVRHGVGSSRLTPASLIVLETRGFKTGQRRRTPLWSLGLGRYRLVSTVRGERSFWVRNLQQDPDVTYYLGGRQRPTRALVFAPDVEPSPNRQLSPLLRRLTGLLSQLNRHGWAFAVLLPAER